MKENQGGIEFEDIGNVNCFIKNFGKCEFIPKKLNTPNILIHIISEQGIEFKLYCSKALSKIIKEEGFTNKFLKKIFLYYRIQRITDINGNTYIRITENWTRKYNYNKSEAWNDNKLKNVKGNAQLLYRINQSNVEIKLRKEILNWKDLILK